MASRRWAVRQLLLILTVLPCCTSLQVSIPQAEYEVARGGEVTLTCVFVPARPELSLFIIKWEALSDNEGKPAKTVATMFSGNKPDIAPLYEGRATLEVDLDQRRGLLTLTQTTLEDSRYYQCSVTIPNDDEGNTAATTSLLVLVAPSKPICRIQGTAEYFQDIKLTCLSEEGSPAPAYDWKSYSVENVQRPFPPKTDQKDGVLSLINITRETSGFFTCSSTNRVGSASCNLTLAVMPPSSNTGTIIIVVGVIAGLLLIAILIYCFCRRKKDKNEPHEERSPGEMEYLDRDAPEGGEQYRDKKKDKKRKDKDKAKKKRGGEEESDDDRQSNSSEKEGRDGKDSSQLYKDGQRDQYRGSQDRLDDQRDQYRGSRDRLDDQRDQYRSSPDRLDNQRDQYRSSRDRLDDQRDQYRSSRDRLDDQRERYGGSRDRLNDGHDRYNYHSSRDDYGDHGGHYSSSHGQADGYE